MHSIVIAVHIVACLTLIIVILLQSGKGADMGAAFGGAASTVFGAGGGGNVMTKITTVTAVTFMATSLTLARERAFYGPLGSPSTGDGHSAAASAAAAPAADAAAE